MTEEQWSLLLSGSPDDSTKCLLAELILDIVSSVNSSLEQKPANQKHVLPRLTSFMYLSSLLSLRTLWDLSVLPSAGSSSLETMCSESCGRSPVVCLNTRASGSRLKKVNYDSKTFFFIKQQKKEKDKTSSALYLTIKAWNFSRICSFHKFCWSHLTWVNFAFLICWQAKEKECTLCLNPELYSALWRVGTTFKWWIGWAK